MNLRTLIVWSSLLLAVIVNGVGVAPLHAQTTAGVRAGVSADPDQFYVGAQIEPPPLTDRIHFRPNVEVGVGHDITLVGVNFELAYVFPSRSDWALYTGGGPALNITRGANGTDAGGGLNILFGGMHESGLFLEVKVGAIDSPDLKLGVGYVFK